MPFVEMRIFDDLIAHPEVRLRPTKGLQDASNAPLGICQRKWPAGKRFGRIEFWGITFEKLPWRRLGSH